MEEPINYNGYFETIVKTLYQILEELRELRKDVNRARSEP